MGAGAQALHRTNMAPPVAESDLVQSSASGSFRAKNRRSTEDRIEDCVGTDRIRGQHDTSGHHSRFTRPPFLTSVLLTGQASG